MNRSESDQPSHSTLSRRRFLVVSVIGSAGSLIAACAQATPAAPTTAPAKPAGQPTTAPTTAPAKPTAAPQPSQSPAAQLSAAAAAKPASAADWDQVVAAAKREGRIAVLGPAGEGPRAVLADTFSKKFGIEVELIQASARQLVPRITTERAANQFLWDVYVGGTSSPLGDLQPAGMLDPIEPSLILPEVTDPKNWRGGGIEFVEDSHSIVASTNRHRAILFINTEQLKAADFKSYKDLLDPKYKGKIVMDDPRVAGPGQATFSYFFLHPDLGRDFIRALLAQEPLVLRDARQEGDAVGQGRYPALVGSDEVVVVPLADQGVPLAIVDPQTLREKSDTSCGIGAISLINRAPHPNAAKVFINWFLSKEGQTEYVRAIGYVSSRLDVPTDHAKPWQIPTPGAISTSGQLSFRRKDEIVPFLESLLPA